MFIASFGYVTSATNNNNTCITCQQNGLCVFSSSFNETCFHSSCINTTCHPINTTCIQHQCVNLTCLHNTNTTCPTTPRTTITAATTTTMTITTTTTKTTTTPTTTPAPTATSTKSPQEIRLEQCNSFSQWLFVYDCSDICNPCAKDVLYNSSDLITCQNERNDVTFLDKYAGDPMIFMHAFNKYTKQIVKNTICPIKIFPYEMVGRLLWHGEIGTRLSDIVVPNYHSREFESSRRRWRKRNDSLFIPYGNMARGRYLYTFTLFEDLMVGKGGGREKFRLREKWPEVHAIKQGKYISLRSENNWLHKPNHIFNSVVMSIQMEPKISDYLPGFNIIAFNHKMRNLTNPICVYWQPVSSGKTGESPNFGYWTNYNMKMIKTNKSMTICHAYTFGSYALLMKPVVVEDLSKPLDVSDIMFLSLIGLATVVQIIYLIGVISLRCHRYVTVRIHIMVSISFILVHGTMLYSFLYRDDWMKCSMFNGWIQFFFLNIISWLLMEAIHHFKNINNFLNRKTDEDLFYYLLGLGFPLSNAIAMMGFIYEQFDSVRFCWIYTSKGDIWYFIFPNLILALTLGIVKFLTFKKFRGKEKLLKTDFNYEQAELSFKSTLAILPTLVIGWSLLSIAVKTTTDHQGLLMVVAPVVQLVASLELFYFFFYRNYWVMQAFIEEGRIREMKKLTTFSFATGMKVLMSYKNSEYDHLENIYEEEDDDEVTKLPSITTIQLFDEIEDY